MQPTQTLPSVVGGSEYTYRVLLKQLVPDSNIYQILDLIGYEYRVEIEAGGDCILRLSEDNGIERISDLPADDNGAHFRLTLSETQTRDLPMGPMLVKLIRVTPEDVTRIALVNLKRIA